MMSNRMNSLPMSRSGSISVLEKPINIFHLKNRREDFANTIRREHEVKRKTFCSNFSLPNQGVAHELFFLWKNKKQDKLTVDERQEMNNDIEKFEK